MHDDDDDDDDYYYYYYYYGKKIKMSLYTMCELPPSSPHFNAIVFLKWIYCLLNAHHLSNTIKTCFTKK